VKRLALHPSLLALALAGAIACDKKKDEPPPPPPPPSVTTTTTPTASVTAAPPGPTKLADGEGRAIAIASCMSCHSEEMLAQQRLTKEKWAAVVKKMAGWGANLDPIDNDKLVAWLADSYGPDAGAYVAEAIDPRAAAAALAPEDDGPLANGDAERGKAIFVERCSGCHGPEAKGAPGALGINLVDRPILRRASVFADTVRRGRGKMVPLKAGDAELGDILAHLRRLRTG
jgi:mono/diheme cytochrome c family protein